MEEGAVEGEVYIAWAMLKYSKFAAAVVWHRHTYVDVPT